MADETSVISFRINKKLKQSLEDECQVKNVSVNHTLNKLVDNHLKWEKFADELGLVFLTKGIFRELLANMNEKELQVLASTICRSALKSGTVFMKGEFNFQNLMEIIDMWLLHSHIPFRRISVDHHEKYILQHDLGLKYSLYLHTAVATVLSEADCTTQNAHLEDQTLSFEIARPGLD